MHLKSQLTLGVYRTKLEILFAGFYLFNFGTANAEENFIPMVMQPGGCLSVSSERPPEHFAILYV